MFVLQYKIEKPVNEDEEEEEEDEDDGFGASRRKEEEEDDDPVIRKLSSLTLSFFNINHK